MTTNMNYSVNVSLYSNINVNAKDPGKDGKVADPKIQTVFVNRLSIGVSSAAPLTAAQLKAEVKKKIPTLPKSEEVIKFKGVEMKDADLIPDVTVAYIITSLNTSDEATTTTTVAPTTTTEAPAP